MTDLQKFKILAFEIKNLLDKYLLSLNTPIEINDCNNCYHIDINNDYMIVESCETGERVVLDFDQFQHVTYDDIYDSDEDSTSLFDPLDL